MQKVELQKVLDLLIAEDREQAEKMLHEWFVGKSKSILEELMQEDDEALDGIQSDKDEIESEEFYGDADLKEAEGAPYYTAVDEDYYVYKFESEEDADKFFAWWGSHQTNEPDTAERAGVPQEFIDALPMIPAGTLADLGMPADNDEDPDAYNDEYDQFTSMVHNLRKFAKEWDPDPIGEAEGDDNAEMSADAEMGMGDEAAVEEVPVEDKVEDLEAQLAALKAEFDKLMGGEEVEHGEDFNNDGEIGAEDEMDADDEFAAESVFEAEEDEEDEEKLDEEFQDLEESFELEKVKNPDMSEGSEAGDGGKVAVAKDSPIPQKKPEARVGGAAVEIKGKTHKGYAREASPSVNSKPILKNQVKNAKADLEAVKPEGDKSALLNKGPAADKGKSPIGGGAVDLRGSDMKRKK